MEEQLEKFETYLSEDEKSQATREKYLRDIRRLFSWLNGREPEKGLIIAYKNQLSESYKAASVNSMLSSINSFFEFCGRHDLRVKTIRAQRALFVPKERELTTADYRRLLAAAKDRKNKRLYYLMQTICSSGIRVSELKFVTVEAVMQQYAEVWSKGKIKTVILPRALCKLLKKYISECGRSRGCIFVTKSGKPLNRSNIWSDMKSLSKRAGVDPSKVFPHNLRHLFARTFYTHQKDIVRLADILGHSSINTTRIYTIEAV